MRDKYSFNIYIEIKRLNHRAKGQFLKNCKPVRLKRYKKLMRYNHMAMGAFKMAKLFR